MSVGFPNGSQVVDEPSHEMIVGAVVPYFGCKRTGAPVIVQELGVHSQYFEPFCASCAVLFAKPLVRMEYVNDLNGDLTNLLRVVAHPDLSLLLFARTRTMLMSEALFREAAERWKARGRGLSPDSPDLESAVDYLYTSWVGRNGVVGTESYNQGFAARYTGRGGHAGTRWASAVDSIPAWHERMRSVVVLNRDAFGLLDKIEDEESTAIYLDPPYIVKGAKYIHDFPTIEEERADQSKKGHLALAAACSRFRKARVVVSYYEHPALADLYPINRWTHVPVPTTKALMCGNGRRGDIGATVAPEVLIVNGPSYSDRGGLFA